MILKRSITVFALAVLAACVLTLRSASAGGGAFCSDPFIFEGSDVNVVVLPFSVRAPDQGYTLRTSMGDLFESRIAQKLSVLIQLDTLYALTYPAGMGVVHLIPDIDDCTPEYVLERVWPQLRDGKGLVLFWGHFLEDEDELYVQTYLRFLRKNRSEDLDVGLQADAGLAATATLTQRAIGFSPRLLGNRDVADVEQAFEGATKIYANSAGDDVVTTLGAKLDLPLAYYVDAVDRETGRMHIVPHEFYPGPEGWITASPNFDTWSLHHKLPELAFLNGVAGYLAARIIADEQQEEHWAGTWTQRLRTASRTSQDQFETYTKAIETNDDSVGDFDERSSLALAYSLSGFLDLVLAANEIDAPDAYSHASSLFATARELAPYQAEVRNLLAISSAGSASFDDTIASASVDDWTAALSLDPTNVQIAVNLSDFLRFALENGIEVAGYDESDLVMQLDSLDVMIQPQ